ncbi:MAG: helix-turn-helix transcriptional regulator [bacterium]
MRFHPSGEEHADAFGPAGAVCLNIELDADWDESLANLGAAARIPSLHDEASWTGLELLRSTADTAGGAPVDWLIVESLVAELLALTQRKHRQARSSDARPIIRRVAEMIEGHLAAPPSLHVLANAVGLHATHLARTFRRAMGCTIGQYARQRRIVHVQRALRLHTAWSISRVAAATGFADHAHLTRTFRREVGITPSAYRRAFAADWAR